MKLKNLFILLFAAILMTFVACNKTSQAAQDTDQTEANAEEGEGTEENESEGDGADTRLSPLREANALIGETKLKITYGSPGVKGRQVWGNLVPYGEVWRTGANEATTFEVDKAVTINGKDLPAGKYGFFSVPKEGGNWTLVFNSIWDQWGAYDYDEGKDVLRVEVSPQTVEALQERLEFQVNAGGNVVVAWEYARVPFVVAEAGS